VSTRTTVRDASFEVLRACGMLDIFANPGSTEVPFLSALTALPSPGVLCRSTNAG
jgi:hypothetical protein